MPSDWTFVSVDLELTNQCSSGCLMCPHKSITRPKGSMSGDIFNRVAEKLIREGSLITLSGMGNPLAHPRVFEWISAIRNSNGDVGIVINPATLTEKIAQKLVTSRPNSITVSFPSIQNGVFERLCPNIPFEAALKQTRKLIDLSRGKTGLRIRGIVTEINSDEPEAYVKFWKKLDVRADMVICHGRGGNLKKPAIYKPKTSGLESRGCGLFQFHTFITWDAEVLACCHDLKGVTRIGNLAIDDVSMIAERKRTITLNSLPFPVCRECDESLRQIIPPQGTPPKSRTERRKFFRSINAALSNLRVR